MSEAYVCGDCGSLQHAPDLRNRRIAALERRVLALEEAGDALAETALRAYVDHPDVRRWTEVRQGVLTAPRAETGDGDV